MNKQTKADMVRADLLMRHFTQAKENKLAAQARIEHELEACAKSMKEAEKELLEIGARNREAFNVDGNLEFETGYIHIANSAVVVLSKKFNLAEFSRDHPELIDAKLKLAPIKKLFQDAAARKELSAYGVSLDNETELQVLVNKKKLD